MTTLKQSIGYSNTELRYHADDWDCMDGPTTGKKDKDYLKNLSGFLSYKTYADSLVMFLANPEQYNARSIQGSNNQERLKQVLRVDYTNRDKLILAYTAMNLLTKPSDEDDDRRRCIRNTISTLKDKISKISPDHARLVEAYDNLNSNSDLRECLSLIELPQGPVSEAKPRPRRSM